MTVSVGLMACSGLRKMHAFMQYIGLFLSGCVLQKCKKVNEATVFYTVRVNEPLDLKVGI